MVNAIRFLRLARRFGAAALCGVLSIGGMTGVAGADDAAVSAAAGRLRTAKDRAAAVVRDLDEAAESYERTNAHLERLDAEAVGSRMALEDADAAVGNAEDVLRQQIAMAYKHPPTEMVLAGSFVDAPDAGSALHQTALLTRFVARSTDHVAEVGRAAELTRSDARQERIIAAGERAALEDWKAQGDLLESMLEEAKRDVTEATKDLGDAERMTRQREQAADAARVAAASAGGAPWSTASPPPIVDGKACPVGTPNGFIDSWGFPRSGGRSHEGVDMFAPMGTPLYAVADGTIWRVYNNSLGGLAINLIDEAGAMYYYAHMSAAHVESGQKVSSGQIIGAVGDSGNARGTPPHVHWQVHPGNASPVNPYPLAQSLCRG